MFILENFNRVKIAEGVHFNTIKDDRFNTSRLCVSLLVPIEREKISANSIVPFLLARSCKKYPDHHSLTRRLDKLYGMSVSSINNKIGDFHSMILYGIGIEDKYALNGESVSREMAELICSMLFEPNVKDGAFCEEDFKQEQRQIIEYIDGEINDKRAYAYQKFIETMFANDCYSVKKYGEKEDVLALTPEKAYEAYLDIIKSARFEIMCICSGDSSEAEKSFKKHFESIKREYTEGKTKPIAVNDAVKEKTESMAVEQSKLYMGFRTDCMEPSDDIYTMKLACAVLGGTAHSKLFRNVREKLSLCYYCSSGYDSNKGLLRIESGVQKENIEKTKNAVLKEIEEMKNGNITDEEILNAKRSITNSYLTLSDNPDGTQVWYLSQVLKNKQVSPKEQAEIINNITKEQIVEAMQFVTLDTIFVLTDKEGE